MGRAAVTTKTAAPPENVEFVQFSDNGKVHVYRGLRPLFGPLVEPGEAGQYIEAAVVLDYRWLNAKQESYCGMTGESGRQYGLDEFLDDDLCGSCMGRWKNRGWPTELLFEHPVPYGDGDG